MQLVGDGNVSPYFTLRGRKGGRPLLKRGFTDIFLVKVKGISPGSLKYQLHVLKSKLSILGKISPDNNLTYLSNFSLK